MNLELMKTSVIPIGVVLYTCQLKTDIFMDDLDIQIERSKNIIETHTKWKIIKHYDDGFTDIENPEDRPLFSKLKKDIDFGIFNNCKIAIFTASVLFRNVEQMIDFIDDLSKHNISLLIFDALIDTATNIGTFQQTMLTAVTAYNAAIIKNIYLIFSGKGTILNLWDCYKGSVRNNQKIIEFINKNCFDDTWIEIVSMKNMKSEFNYKCQEGKIIKDEIENINQLIN